MLTRSFSLHSDSANVVIMNKINIIFYEESERKMNSHDAQIVKVKGNERKQK